MKAYGIITAAVLSLSLAACGGGGSETQASSDEDPPEQPFVYHVEYAVDGPAGQPVVLTYHHGASVREVTVIPPWKDLFSAFPGEDISASVRGVSDAVPVSLRIRTQAQYGWRPGDTVDVGFASSTVPYGIATVNAICCTGS